MTAHVFQLTSCIAAFALSVSAFGDHVERRGSEAALEGTIRLMDDNGVSIQSATGAEMLVTWDHVRKITTNDPSLKSKASEFQDTATALWRARSRLERGDYALAEPLFERLFAQYRGRPNETALIVSEGLLRCRLQRSANDAAVLPALETIRLRRKGVKTSAYQSLSPLFDEATSLCVRLPPAWTPSATLPRVEIDLKTYDAQGDTTVAAIASLYRTAIRQQLGLAAEDVRKLADDQPGVVLLQLLVKGLDPDAGQRAVSRTALEKRLPDLPAWAQAWCRYVIGVSLLAETGVGRHEAALVSLAYMPASYQRDQPYLAALALAMMVLELQRMGESESAAALRSDLIRDFPNHPALGLLEAAPASSAADGNAGTVEYQSMQRLPQKDHA